MTDTCLKTAYITNSDELNSLSKKDSFYFDSIYEFSSSVSIYSNEEQTLSFVLNIDFKSLKYFGKKQFLYFKSRICTCAVK